MIAAVILLFVYHEQGSKWIYNSFMQYDNLKIYQHCWYAIMIYLLILGLICVCTPLITFGLPYNGMCYSSNHLWAVIHDENTLIGSVNKWMRVCLCTLCVYDMVCLCVLMIESLYHLLSLLVRDTHEEEQPRLMQALAHLLCLSVTPSLSVEHHRYCWDPLSKSSTKLCYGFVRLFKPVCLHVCLPWSASVALMVRLSVCYLPVCI